MNDKSTIIPKIIFIIPYRNRASQKTHFDIYMKYILEDYPEDSYKIFFAHQCDNKPFNRGAMKNIGFLVMKKEYPNNYKDITFVFNDIDTMPATKNLMDYNTTHGTVKHFYGFNFALGGIFSIKGSDFEKCKGFPNFWGWGLEDNSIYRRVLSVKLKVDRSQFFGICNPNMIHLLDGLHRSVTRNDKYNASKSDDNMYNIDNLKYKISNELINISNFNTNRNPSDEEFRGINILKINGQEKRESLYYKNKQSSLNHLNFRLRKM